MTDVPARIVIAAARFLPRERREWGSAMLAELAHIDASHDRWLFALGCARAALATPALPDAGILRAIPITFLGGIVAAVATSVYVVQTWPHAAARISYDTVVAFALGLTAYLWLGLRPPNALVSNGNAARRGVAAGFFLFALTAVGRSIIDRYSILPDDDLLIGLFMIPAVAGTILITAFRAARRERSFGAGVVASLWIGLVCSILAFNADLIATLFGLNHEAHVLGTMPKRAGISPDAFLDIHIGDHLASSMDALKRLPIIGLVLGSLAAAVARMKVLQR